jgi:hypothetical protein
VESDKGAKSLSPHAKNRPRCALFVYLSYDDPNQRLCTRNTSEAFLA